MALYRMVNGVKQYIDIDAGTVKFQDGDSFQDKLDGGSLKGQKGDTGAAGKNGTNGTNGADGVSPTVSVTKSGTTATISITDKNGAHSTTIKDGATGATGPQGPSGSDATVTRDSVIDALGYTPSNSGLSKTDVEKLINSNKKKDISVVKLPFVSEQYSDGDYDPPSDSVGISTFFLGRGWSGEFEYRDRDGTVHTTTDSSNELGAIFAGLTVHTNDPKVGFHLGAANGGLYIRFKGQSDYTSYTTSNNNGATGWMQIINRYGVVSNANSLVLMEYYSGYATSNWKNWNFSSFRKGLSTFAISIDSEIYFALLFNFGNANPLAKYGYEHYNASESKGTLLLIPHDFGSNVYIWALKLNNGVPTAYKRWKSM